jgi:hypothetical protein
MIAYYDAHQCLQKDILDIGCLYNGDTQPAEAMHSPIKDIWRFSSNHREGSEKQLLKIHSTNEEIRLFSDTYVNKSFKRVKNAREPCLTSAVREPRHQLDDFANSHAEDNHFDALVEKIVQFVSEEMGELIDREDIMVINRSTFLYDPEVMTHFLGRKVRINYLYN